jgi:GNAT superfamily N-acetyltransferase
MNTDDILALYDQQMRIDPPATGAEVVRQDGLILCLPTARSTFGGWIIYTQLTSANADEAIRGQVQAMRASGKDWEWKTYGHDTPPDLKPRLLAHGFEAEEPEALLALDLAQAPGRLWERVKADLRRLRRPEEIDAVVRVHDAVWGETGDDLAQELRRDLAETPHSLSVYAVYDQGQPVSAAWIRFHEGRDFADLWGGSTIAAYRGRGYYSDLVAVRAQEARARGFRFLTIDASAMSRPILEKIGFRFLTWTQPFVWRQAERSSISQA